MQKDWSYIKDSGNFINKAKSLSTIPNNDISVTTDVVGWYPRIVYVADWGSLREALDKEDKKSVPTEDLVEVAGFMLKNDFFEFSSKIKLQVLGLAIGTKLASPNTNLFMDKFETSFLETQKLQPLLWFRYIDYIFFVWTHGGEKRNIFFEIS